MGDTSLELSHLFSTQEFDPETVESYADLAFASARSREKLQELVAAHASERGAGALPLGIACLILGKYKEALEALERAADSKYRRYYAAQAAAALGRIPEAIAELQAAASQGWDALETDMQITALRIRAGEIEAAEKLIARHERGGADRACWYYASGLLREARGQREEALEAWKKALKLSPEHVEAQFRAARLYDMLGDDRRAIELYEKIALQPRCAVNALINLAVLYEDLGRYEQAEQCLRRVLATYPNHTRARLFLKDVQSSLTMVIDEVTDQRTEVRNRLLDTPLAELEFSPRARTYLKKLKINTVADLIRLSEAELLATRTVGEATLQEIKTVLEKRGLRLGQPPEAVETVAAVEPPPPRVNVPPGSEAILVRLVSELDLSVRARRCLQRLNIITIGELIQHTEAELLAARNFGVTSLNEIKARLAEVGLQLASKA